VDDQLPGLPVEGDHGRVEGLEKRVTALAANGIHVVGVDAVEADAAEVAEEGVLGLERNDRDK
jgi:hypothetical protein